MTFTGYTGDGSAHALGEPLSVSLDMALDTPADRLEAAFPLKDPIPELHEVRAQHENEVVFFGVVDEQTAEYARGGARLYLSARSLAAHLLDNEAVIQNYYKPTLLEIFNRHVKPYKIIGLRGSGLAYNGTLTVGKGMSEWGVLTRFCQGVGGLWPRVTPDRYLDVRLNLGETVFTYSNTAANGLRHSSLAHTVKRCEPVSAVVMKSFDGGTYQFTEQNPLVRGTGIIRKRLLEIRRNAGEVQQSAKELMRASNYEYDQYVLRVTEERLPQPGNRAALRDAALGEVRNLVVGEIRYRLSESGSYYDAVLIPEANFRI